MIEVFQEAATKAAESEIHTVLRLISTGVIVEAFARGRTTTFLVFFDEIDRDPGCLVRTIALAADRLRVDDRKNEGLRHTSDASRVYRPSSASPQ